MMIRFQKIFILFLVIVGFGLVQPELADAQDRHNHSADTVKYYCPMHPQVISDKPGDCPICHMRLVSNKTTPSEAESTPSAVEGRVPVRINQASQTNVGIRTEPVAQRPLTKKIEAWGEVAHDFELYQLQTEFFREERLYFERTRERTPVAQKRGITEREKIAVKFQEMGLSPEWIQSIEKAGVPDARLIEHREGAGIWIYLRIRENEAAFVRVGDPVMLTTPSLPDLKIGGKVEFIDGLVDMESKTVRVRLVIPQSPMSLKPNMSVSALITVDLGKTLSISEEAPLFTGKRTLVFVEENEVFTPREVLLGPKAGDYYPVLEGLKEGEKISSAGNFFIDSESRLRSSLAGASHGGHSS